MKKIITLLFLALIVQVSIAQEKDEKIKEEDSMQTLFTKDNLKFTGGYLSPIVKVGDVYEDISLFVGGKMGFTFNEHFTIGLAGFGLTTNSNFDINNNPLDPASIRMGYGGLNLEYTFFSNKKIHFTIPVMIGAAGISVYEDNDDNNGDFLFDNYNKIENSAAFVVEPGVNIELNLFKFFRLNIGAAYRLVEGTALEYLSDEDLSDLTFNVGFKFGFF
jgi:hypothetical protein